MTDNFLIQDVNIVLLDVQVLQKNPRKSYCIDVLES